MADHAVQFPRRPRHSRRLALWFWRRRHFWGVLFFWPLATATLTAILLAPVFGPPTDFFAAFGQDTTGAGSGMFSFTNWSASLGILILVGGLMLGLSLYLVSWVQKVASRPRSLMLVLAVLALTVLAARVTLPEWSGWAYAFPLAASAMVIAALLDVQLGLVVGLILAFLVGAVVGNSLALSLIYAAGAAIGALGMRRVNRLARFAFVGLLVGLSSLPLIAAFTFMSPIQPHDIGQLITLSLVGLVGGELSGIMALSLYSFFGSLFGITTMLQLFDSSRPNHPLLHRLLLEAPGTYHHSIVMAAMAERAAQEIGADSLLARVGGFYHDVGKIVHPQLFVENQFNGRNVHDQLTPLSSAKLIRAHVAQGLRMANKHHLPARVRDCIAEHHGTSRIEFFYDKARREAAENGLEPPDEKPFRYKGPKPQSKETAILMLADGVEPMVRSGQAGQTPEEMDAAIQQFFQDRLADGQLAESGLSIQELDPIRQAFLSILRGIFHQRIPYPDLHAEEYAEPDDQTADEPAFSKRQIKQVS
ncbi:MAG TPA: HDIG domain-containing metalloprotein [Ktedonobacterales bacterium]